MKKKVISFLLVLCMITALLPLGVMAAGNGTLDNPWTSGSVKVYRDGSTLYVFGSGDMNDYANAKSPEWYSVSGNIKRIVIESSVTALGENAFKSCGSVETIEVKRDLDIGGAALNMAQSSLPTGGSVELRISGSAYMPDYDVNQPWANLKTRLAKVTVTEGVKSIGAQAFSGCTKLRSVEIPGSAEYIGKEAFANCVNLSSVKLSHDFTGNQNSGKPFTIGSDAFPAGNENFHIALVITGNTAIPSYGSADEQPWANYRGCLTELVIGGDVPGIGNNAFHSCDKLKSITVYFNENAYQAQKVFGRDTFKYSAYKTLNVVALSEEHAFKNWEGATFSSVTNENAVLYYDATGMTVTANWSEIKRSLKLTPETDKSFGDLEAGYAPQTPYQVTVLNGGNVPTGQLQVELSGGYPDAFALSTRTLSSLKSGFSSSFTVAPAAGMANGDYFTTVIVSDDEATVASFRVSFSVGTADTRAERFVKRLYTKALGRAEEAVTEEELNGYVKPLVEKTATAAQTAAAFFTSDEFRARGLNNGDFVKTLYEALLNRTPSAAEVKGYVDALTAGKSRSEIFGIFVGSEEFGKVCTADTIVPGTVNWKGLDMSNKVSASASAIAFCTRLYKNVLNRDPDEEGLKNWSTILTNGNQTAAQVAAGFFSSAEYLSQKKSNRDFAIDLYHTMMDREPDASGLQNWVDNMGKGMKRSTVFNGFCTSPEFNNLCASYGFAAGSIDPDKCDMGANSSEKDVAKMSETDATALVTALYNTILNRAPDEGGLADKKQELMEGKVTHAQLTAGFTGSAEFVARELNDEQFVNILFSALLGRTPNPAEMVSWTSALQGGNSRSAIFSQICATEEYKNYCNTNGYTWGNIDPKKYVMESPKPTAVVTQANAAAFVNRCYQAALGRTPGGNEADGWINSLMYNKVNAAQLAAGILSSAEAKGRLTDNTSFLHAAYQILFGRNADESGLNSWGSALTKGATRSQVFAELLKSAEFTAKCKEFGLTPGSINAAAYDMG